MIYLLSIMTSFVAVFLKVFQQKNVIGGHMKLMVGTSYLMAAFDVASIAMIIHAPSMILIAMSSGTGGALGVIASVTLHDRLVKNRVKPDEKKKAA